MKLIYSLTTILLITFLIGVITPDEYYVSKLYKGEHIYSQIQEAIDHAKPGAVIIIRPGTYRENIVIDKPVKIISLGWKKLNLKDRTVHHVGSNATIIARDSNKPVVKVMAEGVSIVGFNIKGGSYGLSLLETKRSQILYNRIASNSAAGIYIQGGGENKLLGNRLEKNMKGIYLSRSSHNCVKKNQIIDSLSHGIYLKRSGENSLKSNWIKGGQYGLIIASSSNNLLKNNGIKWRDDKRDTYPFRVWGTEIAHFMQKIDSTNAINGRPIYYLVEEKNRTIDASMKPGYIALVKSQNIKLSNLTISNRREGITVVDCAQIELVNNTLKRNGTGIYLLRSTDSIIRGNSLTSSKKQAIHLISSTGNKIEENYISESSDYALFLDDSSRNEISGNTIAANKQYGIFLKLSDQNRLLGNKLTGNEKYGILLKGAKGNMLEGNILKDNWVGIMLERSDSNTMVDNQIEKNKMGIFLNQAKRNEISDNLFQENERSDIGGGLEGNNIKY